MLEKLNISHYSYKSNSKNLEALIFKPDGDGPFPAVYFVHGHGHSGAWEASLSGFFLQKAGYVAILPSQMGYGLSEGERDFCGPKTVHGVVDLINETSSFEFVNKEKIGIWGVSRGATVVSQVITKITGNIKCAVLQAGVHDMTKEIKWPSLQEGIKENMIKETGGTDAAFHERSSIFSMENLACSVLILHGDQDKNVNVEQARLLDEKLTELGKSHKTVILEGKDHFIGRETRKEYVFPFLNKYLM